MATITTELAQVQTALTALQTDVTAIAAGVTDLNDQIKVLQASSNLSTTDQATLDQLAAASATLKTQADSVVAALPSGATPAPAPTPTPTYEP